MPQTCGRCSRANPDEALFCYFDGIALGTQGGNGGPIHTGTQPFHNPFTFPSGKTCRNFDQLALTCQDHWAEALELLKQGYLESFLGGLGRADLALAAREAAQFPDLDRGLDQFLTKLPSDVLDAPKLNVEPREVNLGLLKVGEDRQLELHLTNKGMRLLYGSVNCGKNLWLTLGQTPGTPQKIFQFGDELEISINVRGQYLRASPKPLEGRLTIDSNGGTETVVLRANIPVKPFPEGVLAGAKNPRQVAEKAQAAPKEAAVLFEKGAVAAWYEDNGWTYPVEGPSASGIGAVQQFFEALGMTRAPKVEMADRSVTLSGTVGVELRHQLEVRTQEKRPVYAHGRSDQPWLEVGRAQLKGRTAIIPLVVAAVPDREGETLRAKVTVIANGNQRFKVPVTLEVGGSFDFGTFDTAPVVKETPMQAESAAPAQTEPAPEEEPRSQRRRKNNWVHALPTAFLILALLGVIVWDVVKPPAVSSTAQEETKAAFGIALDDPEPRLDIRFHEETMRFGILMRQENDPKNPQKAKQLTAKEDGRSNNTCVLIDKEFAYLLGRPPGAWAKDPKTHQVLHKVILRKDRGWMSTWEFPSKIQVRQSVEIIPNEQTRLLDTCLVHYLIANLDSKTHKVGLRVMLDTYIGANDGVPFAIPGQPGLLETMKEFGQKDLPDYVQALERSDLRDPGTIAHLGLKLPEEMRIRPDDPPLEPIKSLLICRWPGTTEIKWRWEPKPMNQKTEGEQNDSCVALYWDEEAAMAPQSRRAMAFTYGLGKVSSGDQGDLALTLGGASFRPGGTFTVTAYVKDPTPGQKVRLVLPEGLVLDEVPGQEKQKEEQIVDKGTDYSQVSWRVRAPREGDYRLEVATGLARAHQTVRIRKAGLFD